MIISAKVNAAIDATNGSDTAYAHMVGRLSVLLDQAVAELDDSNPKKAAIIEMAGAKI